MEDPLQNPILKRKSKPFLQALRLNLKSKLLSDQKLIDFSKKRKFSFSGLIDSLKALWVLKLVLQKNSSLKLVVTKDIEQMHSFRDNFKLLSPNVKVSCLPNLDTLPYDDTPSDPKIVAQRILTLHDIFNQQCDLVITTLPALSSKILPKQVLSKMLFKVSLGSQFSRQAWLKKLKILGYIAADNIESPGEFCFKGDKLDVFSANYDHPLRISFFGDEVDGIKFFDLDTQRSKTKKSLDSFDLVAASEVLYTQDNIIRALDKLDDYRQNISKQHYDYVLNNLKNGVIFGFAAKIMPTFYESTDTLFDYLPADCKVFLIEEAKLKAAHHFLSEETSREYLISQEQQQITLPLDEILISWQSILNSLSKYLTADLATDPLALDDGESLFSIDNQLIVNKTNKDQRSFNNLRELFNQIKLWQEEGVKIAFFAKFLVTAQRIKSYLSSADMSADIIEQPSATFIEQLLLEPEHKGIIIIVSDLTKGYRLYDNEGFLRQAVISDFDLFGKQASQKTKRKSFNANLLNLNSLKVGDYVTHIDYGIGRYAGLTHFPYQQNITDCVVINYYGNDKVYLPVEDLKLIQKYASVDVHQPSVHKLGDSRWKKQKSKVKKALEDIAQELLTVYAKRKTRPGISFKGSEEEMTDFVRLFEYDATEDQKQAIEDVLTDLSAPKPMDRLICGDVGFGKTEVALRAAFRVASCGYQVALVVPTTVLAEQHFITFKQRFQHFDYRIACLNRFQPKASVLKILRDLASGKISVVIGTHRLLSKDVVFNKLGLLIIDEEHRFGVKQKEKMRFKRTQVDTLALSATPIPRSLQMSLSGIRDISMINTAPVDRRKIKTRVLNFAKDLIKEVIQREVRRSGQVYFVHNRVATIEQMADFLRKILPDVGIKVAHGQMPQHQLETVMQGFIKGHFSVLLSSIIIESGLDIPNANTLVVNDADKLGLSQLYQIRGRIGRSATQAYAYLLVDGQKVLSQTAEKRLKILQEHSNLGSGLKIAAYDLEIRGAGDFLGAQQSGNMSLVGVDTYLSMLEEAMQKIQNQSESSDSSNLNPVAKVKLKTTFDAFLPASYIKSSSQRLSIYQDIADCKTEEEIWDLASLLEDRFGSLPSAAKCLLDCARLKIWSAKIFAVELNVNKENLTLSFDAGFKPKTDDLFSFLQHNNGKVIPPLNIKFVLNSPNIEDKIDLVKSFYSSLTVC